MAGFEVLKGSSRSDVVGQDEALSRVNELTVRVRVILSFLCTPPAQLCRGCPERERKKPEWRQDSSCVLLPLSLGTPPALMCR